MLMTILKVVVVNMDILSFLITILFKKYLSKKITIDMVNEARDILKCTWFNFLTMMGGCILQKN